VVAFSPILEASSDITWLALPAAGPEKIVEYARKRKADFLVLSGADGYWQKYTLDDMKALLPKGAAVVDGEFNYNRYVIFDVRQRPSD